MGVRLYSPTLGRFLQVDPVPGGSANAYDYSNQDPVNEQDLSGQCPACAVASLGGLEAIGAADWWNPVGWTIAGGLGAYAGFKGCRSWRRHHRRRHHHSNNTMLAENNKTTKKKIESLEEEIKEHYGKVEEDVRRGDEGAARHHMNEINGWKKQIERLRKRLR